MPTSTNDYPATITGYENRIHGYAALHMIPVSRRMTKRLAYELHKRGARMRDTDLERVFMHADPTPREAIRNIEREAAA